MPWPPTARPVLSAQRGFTLRSPVDAPLPCGGAHKPGTSQGGAERHTRRVRIRMRGGDAPAAQIAGGPRADDGVGKSRKTRAGLTHSTSRRPTGQYGGGGHPSNMRLGKVPKGMGVEAARYVLNDEVIGMLYAGGSADQAGLVHRYMTDEGFEASRTGVAGGGSWDAIFDEHEVDILLAGNHPDGADACVEFARRVVQRNPLIDVLVHGVRSVEPITKYDRSLYTALLTHPGTDYAGRAIGLIRTHRKKWNDVIFLRGMVITQIVNVEAHINDALAAHFGLEPGTPRGGQFEEYVLENPMYMLEGKKRALSKILGDAGLGHMWRGMNRWMSDMQSKRNKMAHCEVDPDNPNVIESMGRTYRYDRQSMRDALRDARLVRQRLLDITEALRERR